MCARAARTRAPQLGDGGGRERENMNRKTLDSKTEKVMSARVNTDLYKAVTDLAKKKDLTVTQVVRASIRDYLGRHHAA